MLAKKVQTIINFLTMPICKTFGKICKHFLQSAIS